MERTSVSQTVQKRREVETECKEGKGYRLFDEVFRRVPL